MYRSAAAVASSDVLPCWRALRYGAYQSHQSWAGAAFSKRSWCMAVSSSSSASVATGVSSTRPGRREVTSCSRNSFPSGSLNVANEP